MSVYTFTAFVEYDPATKLSHHDESLPIERYLGVKLAHPGAVVFLRVGSFYQTLFEDAALCGRGLRLAVRNLAADSEPEKIPSCGFPLRVLEKYVMLLQQRGREAHVE